MKEVVYIEINDWNCNFGEKKYWDLFETLWDQKDSYSWFFNFTVLISTWQDLFL